jgi:hypothetical protein
LGLATSSTPLAAQEPGPEAAPGLPLWEIALGATGLYGPDCPASDEYHPNGLAAPLFIYRGAILQLGERDIARVVAVDRGRFRLDFSLDASYRAGSDDNDARAGMPDLDYLGEVGPQLVVEMSELTMPEPAGAARARAADARGIRHRPAQHRALGLHLRPRPRPRRGARRRAGGQAARAAVGELRQRRGDGLPL